GETRLELRDQAGPDSPAAMVRDDGYRVDPSAMAVVSAHGRSNDPTLVLGDKEQAVVDGQLEIDLLIGVVPGAGQPGGLPQLDDSPGVVGAKRPDHRSSSIRRAGFAMAVSSTPRAATSM